MTTAYQFDELPVLHGLSEPEFFRLCQDNPQLRLERAANQDIIIMPPAHPDASEDGLEVAYQLKHWVRTTDAPPGHAYESSAGFRLPDGSVRAPDVAWLSNARRAGAEQAAGFLAACPEFVVEVLSPSDRLATTQVKMAEYLANGVQLGFLLDVAAETAYVYRPGLVPETVRGFDQTLSGEPVLPGFALDLRPLRRAR
ncbi:Uma2 family endonuclease [Hymenobacter sp.]|uniref:Uma2 family endonuclease n=1 Tax=Hymenobacter sp. TaxID=1898978 RepID=UPI00286A4175|nr:Uma2 family endonuclease [Hymenobacter sp.]